MFVQENKVFKTTVPLNNQANAIKWRFSVWVTKSVLSIDIRLALSRATESRFLELNVAPLQIVRCTVLAPSHADLSRNKTTWTVPTVAIIIVHLWTRIILIYFVVCLILQTFYSCIGTYFLLIMSISHCRIITVGCFIYNNIDYNFTVIANRRKSFIYSVQLLKQVIQFFSVQWDLNWMLHLGH